MLPLHHSPMPCSFSTAKHSIAKAGGPVKRFFKKTRFAAQKKAEREGRQEKKPDGVRKKGKIWKKPEGLSSVFSKKRDSLRRKKRKGKTGGKRNRTDLKKIEMEQGKNVRNFTESGRKQTCLWHFRRHDGIMILASYAETKQRMPDEAKTWRK